MGPADRPGPGALPSPDPGETALDQRGDALLDLRRDLRAGGQAGLQDVLEAGVDGLGLGAHEAGLGGRVLGDRADLALEAGAALTQLTLDAGARALDLALQRLAGG